MFQKGTISNYEGDQYKQSETGQESEEDNIDNETISVTGSEKSEISVVIGRRAYHKKGIFLDRYVKSTREPV